MHSDFEMENEKQIWGEIVVEKLLCFWMKEKNRKVNCLVFPPELFFISKISQAFWCYYIS